MLHSLVLALKFHSYNKSEITFITLFIYLPNVFFIYCFTKYFPSVIDNISSFLDTTRNNSIVLSQPRPYIVKSIILPKLTDFT